MLLPIANRRLPIEGKGGGKRYLRLFKTGNWQSESAIPSLVLVYIHVFGIDDVVVC